MFGLAIRFPFVPDNISFIFYVYFIRFDAIKTPFFTQSHSISLFVSFFLGVKKRLYRIGNHQTLLKSHFFSGNIKFIRKTLNVVICTNRISSDLNWEVVFASIAYLPSGKWPNVQHKMILSKPSDQIYLIFYHGCVFEQIVTIKRFFFLRFSIFVLVSFSVCQCIVGLRIIKEKNCELWV